MVAAAPETVESLKKELADLKESVTKRLASQPDLSGARVYVDGEGRVVGTVEPTDEEATVLAYEGQRSETRGNYKRLKSRASVQRKEAGYRPGGEFKSAAEFYRYGIENRNQPSK